MLPDSPALGLGDVAQPSPGMPPGRSSPGRASALQDVLPFPLPSLTPSAAGIRECTRRKLGLRSLYIPNCLGFFSSKLAELLSIQFSQKLCEFSMYLIYVPKSHTHNSF